jgi:serine/threonine protein phosphatase PrpC
MNTAISPLTDARIWSAQDFGQAKFFAVSAGTMAVYTARAPNKLTGSEDAVAYIPFGDESCVLAVADGVGGLPRGEVASRMAVDILRARLTAVVGDLALLKQAILDGMNEANRRLLDEGRGAATTLVVAEVQGNAVRSYHVGDSMILIAGQSGEIKLQTVAHSPVGYAVEAGLLDEKEAMQHEYRNVVSNVVGMENMRIEVSSSVRFSTHDTLIVTSDGLPDNLYTKEIVERACSGPLHESAQGLLELSRRRMRGEGPALPSHADDLSFILFRPRASIAGKADVGD